MAIARTYVELHLICVLDEEILVCLPSLDAGLPPHPHLEGDTSIYGRCISVY